MILSILVISISYNMVIFWEFRIKEQYHIELLLRANPIYLLWRVTIANLAFTYLIPLMVMSLLTTLVAREMNKALKVRRQISVHNETLLAQRGNQETAKMLSYVVLSEFAFIMIT